MTIPLLTHMRQGAYIRNALIVLLLLIATYYHVRAGRILLSVASFVVAMSFVGDMWILMQYRREALR